jgi:hypothetical protein
METMRSLTGPEDGADTGTGDWQPGSYEPSAALTRP